MTMVLTRPTRKAWTEVLDQLPATNADLVKVLNREAGNLSRTLRTMEAKGFIGLQSVDVQGRRYNVWYDLTAPHKKEYVPQVVKMAELRAAESRGGIAMEKINQLAYISEEDRRKFEQWCNHKFASTHVGEWSRLIKEPEDWLEAIEAIAKMWLSGKLQEIQNDR